MSVSAFGNQINFYLELFLIFKFSYEVLVGGWYRSLLSRGGTKGTYVFSLMFCDFILYVIFMQGFYLSNIIYGVDMTGWQELIWAFILA